MYEDVSSKKYDSFLPRRIHEKVVDPGLQVFRLCNSIFFQNSFPWSPTLQSNCVPQALNYLESLTMGFAIKLHSIFKMVFVLQLRMLKLEQHQEAWSADKSFPLLFLRQQQLTATMFGDKAVSLLKDLDRGNDFLTPYNLDLVNEICEEMSDLFDKNKDDV